MMLRQEVFNSLASGSRSVRAHVVWASVMATMASSNCNPQPICIENRSPVALSKLREYSSVQTGRACRRHRTSCGVEAKGPLPSPTALINQL